MLCALIFRCAAACAVDRANPRYIIDRLPRPKHNRLHLSTLDTHASHPHGRVEDFRLVTGTGCYAADWTLTGQLYAHFVRTDRAHAEIVSVDVEKAARHPGVKRVYTGKDALRAGYDKFLV